MRVTILLCAGLLALSMTATQAHATYSMSTGGSNGKSTLDGSKSDNGGFLESIRQLQRFGAGKDVRGSSNKGGGYQGFGGGGNN